MHAGLTKQLRLNPEDNDEVLLIKASDMQEWQREYAIGDIFDRTMVFVPATRAIDCKLFRANHDPDDPSYWCYQLERGICVFYPLKQMDPGGDITFDYFGGDADSTPSNSQSLSLSSLSGSPDVLTGNGKTTTAELFRGIEERWRKWGGKEACAALAFACDIPASFQKCELDGHFGSLR